MGAFSNILASDWQMKLRLFHRWFFPLRPNQTRPLICLCGRVPRSFLQHLSSAKHPSSFFSRPLTGDLSSPRPTTFPVDNPGAKTPLLFVPGVFHRFDTAISNSQKELPFGSPKRNPPTWDWNTQWVHPFAFLLQNHPNSSLKRCSKLTQSLAKPTPNSPHFHHW